MAHRGPRITLAREAQALANAEIDDATRRLLAAYAQAWTDVADMLEATALLEAERIAADPLLAMRRSAQLQAALAVLTGQLTSLAEQHGILVQGALHSVVAGGPDAVARMVAASGQAVGFGFRRPSSAKLAAIVQRTSGRIESLSKPLAAEARAALHTGLVQGVAAGDNPMQVARRIVRNASDVWGSQLARAMTISRTELIDASREATRQTYASSPVVTGWVWMSSGGPRTCPACLAMSGTVHGKDETLEGHPNCRCVAVPLLAGETAKTIGVPDGETMLRRLTPVQQLQVLGPARRELVAAGLPVRAMATRTETEGWRASQQVTPVKDLQGLIPGGKTGTGGAGGTPPKPPIGPVPAMNIPVSGALVLPPAGSRLHQVGVEALAEIDALHTDGQLAPLPLIRDAAGGKARLGPGVLGGYAYQQKPGIRGVEIRLSAVVPESHFTLVHEIGHWLDHQVLGQRGTHASQQLTTQVWRDFHQATGSSTVIRQIQHLRATATDQRVKDYADYLLRPREIWARAYSQWVATVGGGPSLADLNALRSKYAGSGMAFRSGQWDDDDFTEIGAAVEAVLHAMGWR